MLIFWENVYMSLQYLIDAYKFKYVLNLHDEQLLVNAIQKMNVEERGILAELCLSIIKHNPDEVAVDEAYKSGYAEGMSDADNGDDLYDEGFEDGYNKAKREALSK